jgi:hypothetical protein
MDLMVFIHGFPLINRADKYGTKRGMNLCFTVYTIYTLVLLHLYGLYPLRLLMDLLFVFLLSSFLFVVS